MRWSLTLGSIGGTAIRIHVTFLLFLIWLGAIYYRQGGAEAAWQGDRRSAVEALASNPLVWPLDIEQVTALYDEMAQAHAQWLPDRLRRI